MRDPPRKVLYCLIACLVAAALISLGIDREMRIGQHWTSIVPVALGLAIAPFALVTLVQALFAWRGRTLLLRGEGVIARWHVFPGEWEQFRALDERRTGSDMALANDLWIRRARPTEAVEVVIGENSLIVDRSYHVLRPGGIPSLDGVGWLEGPPLCLEFALVYPRGRHGGTLRLTLRVPVPAGSRAAALKVYHHFEPRTRKRPGLALRNPRKTYRVCALLLVGGTAMAGLGYGFAGPVPNGYDLPLPILLVVLGLALGAFAIVLSLCTFLLTRRT